MMQKDYGLRVSGAGAGIIQLTGLGGSVYAQRKPLRSRLNLFYRLGQHQRPEKEFRTFVDILQCFWLDRLRLIGVSPIRVWRA